MMGRQTVDQSQLFYLFNLEEHIPADHLLRRINPIVTRVLSDLREKLAPFYSDIGRLPKLILGWPASPKVRAPSLVHWAPCLPVPSLRSGQSRSSLCLHPSRAFGCGGSAAMTVIVICQLHSQMCRRLQKRPCQRKPDT
jgi:hypothetical protein